MPDERIITEMENLLFQIVEIGGQKERTSIVPNMLVRDASPTGLDDYVIIADDRDNDNILALKVPGVIYSVNDQVNVIFPKGGEAIAFQQGSLSSNGGIWEVVPGTSTDIYYDKGNVGIDTTTPDYSLQVGNGAASVTLAAGENIVFVGPNSAGGRLILEGTSQADIYLIDGGAAANDKAMQLYTDGGITKFRAMSDAAAVQTDNIIVMDHSNGYVGFGSSPSYPVHSVSGNSLPNVVEQTNAANAACGVYYNSGVGATYAGGFYQAAKDAGGSLALYSFIAAVPTSTTVGNYAGDLTFWTALAASRNERMRITSAGDVGINTTSPATYLAGTRGLTIYDGATSLPGLAWGNASNYWVNYMSGSDLRWYENSGTAVRVVIQSGGNVGVNGITSPSTALDMGAGAIEFEEMTAPAAGAANTARDYAEDDGSGNTQRRIKFSSGNAVTIAKDGGLATYTPSNVTTDRSYDANSTTLDELADVVGTLIADFQAAGILG